MSKMFFALYCVSALLVPTIAAASPSAAGRFSTRQTLIQMPLRFEANSGQSAANVKFVARGPGYTMLLAAGEAVLSLRGGAVRMRVVDANPAATAKGLEQLDGVSNYLIGNDESRWIKNVSSYARVKFDAVYPGIDMIYYGSQRKLEYDFVVAPGADPSRIRLEFEGAGGLSVDDMGDLLIDGPEGVIRQHAPVVYQDIRGARRMVAGHYAIENGERVAFRLGAYDRKRELVIDPKLSYSTYIGTTADDGIFDIAVDSSGNVYAAGITGGSNFPTTTGALDTFFGPSQITNYLTPAYGDIFVTKFAPDGKTLVYSTFVGGGSADGVESIVVNSSGQVALVGATNSSDYPTKNGYRTTLLGLSMLPTDIVVTMLNAAGNGLIYSTYFGTTDNSVFDASFEGAGITFDSTGAIIIASQVLQGGNLPTRNAYQSTNNGGRLDAFVAKFDPTKTGDASLIFSTFLGGTGMDSATAVAVDSNNNVYVRGGTCSSNFPVTANAYQSSLKGTCDAFLSKLSANGSTLLYSTYFGGSNTEYGEDNEANEGPMSNVLPWRIYSSQFGGSYFGGGLAVDQSGNVYIGGTTRSTDLPVSTGAFQTASKGSIDAFLAKFDTTKTGAASLIYSTYLGGSNCDRARAVAVDANGVAFVHGETKSSSFPITTDAIQSTPGGNWDSFVSAISADGKSLLYSTFFGGSGDEQGLYGMRLDGKGGLYFGSASKSTNYPTTTGAYQTVNKGGWEAVLTKIDLGPQIVTVVNAASSQGGAVSPSEFVSFYGANMGPATGVPSATEVKGLGNVKVTFDDIEAFMTYASATQLNVVAPYKISGTTNARVTYGGNTSLPFPMQVAAAAPGIFTQQYGAGQAWVVNVQDWTFNSSTNAAARESYIEFWVTGQGLVTPESADGAVIQDGAWPVPVQPVKAIIGGKEVTPIWVGLVYTGMIQVNVQVPADATTGAAVPLQVKIGNATSRADVTVAIKPKT